MTEHAEKSAAVPELSILLHDWSVRERFHTVRWLSEQTVARGRYEIIWVEMYERLVDEVARAVNVHFALGQTGQYHKHKAMNAALAVARGRVVTLCDSDAVYPPDFVENVLGHFPAGAPGKVLMHYELRSQSPYPDGADDLERIKAMSFLPRWPNVGACMSVLRRDAIGFGGVDEHDDFIGYCCGHNDLGWRMINAGIPEEWEERVVTWHFHHPGAGSLVDAGFLYDDEYRHIEGHNATAVRAFCEGRLLPLVENRAIFRLRMRQRAIGTDFERRFAWWGRNPNA